MTAFNNIPKRGLNTCDRQRPKLEMRLNLRTTLQRVGPSVETFSITELNMKQSILLVEMIAMFVKIKHMVTLQHS